MLTTITRTVVLPSASNVLMTLAGDAQRRTLQEVIARAVFGSIAVLYSKGPVGLDHHRAAA